VKHLKLLSVLVNLNDPVREQSVCFAKLRGTLECLQIHWGTEFKFSYNQEKESKNLRRTFRMNKYYLL